MEKYVIIDWDSESAHCFSFIYENWEDAVEAVLEEANVTAAEMNVDVESLIDEEDKKVLMDEGYLELADRKLFIETVTPFKK